MPFGQVRHITPRHYQILELAAAGKGPYQIACELDMNSNTVSSVFNSPSFQHQLAIYNNQRVESTIDTLNAKDEAIAILRAGAIAAARKLVEKVLSPDDRTAIKCATEILDRTGYAASAGASANAANAGTQIIINAEQMTILQETLLQASANGLSPAASAANANNNAASSASIGTKGLTGCPPDNDDQGAAFATPAGTSL